jgi:cytosine/adenosine deaminase-related metal-dependent hydrolase
MTTLIEGGDVLAFDGHSHRLLRGGVVAFENGVITRVGRSFDGSADHRIDATGMLVCPGFINTHVHVGIEVMTSLLDVDRAPERGSGSSPAALAGARSEMLSRRWISPSYRCVSTFPAATLSEDEQRTHAEFALVQLLKSGCTTTLNVGGLGTLWWLGNPPGDVEILAETVGGRRPGARAGDPLYRAL